MAPQLCHEFIEGVTMSAAALREMIYKWAQMPNCFVLVDEEQGIRERMDQSRTEWLVTRQNVGLQDLTLALSSHRWLRGHVRNICAAIR